MIQQIYDMGRKIKEMRNMFEQKIVVLQRQIDAIKDHLALETDEDDALD